MEVIRSHKRNLTDKIKQVKSWKISAEEKKQLLDFIEDYRAGKITGKVGTNPEALVEKILQRLSVCLTYFKNKEYTEKNIDSFVRELLSGKIKKYNHRTGKYDKGEYSVVGKREILSYFSRYLKWKLSPKKYAVLSSSLEVKISKKEGDKPFLTEGEILKLYQKCRTKKHKYLIANLFSTGARIEEFLNIRYSDYELPKGKEQFVKVRLRGEFTKTLPRTIPLYFKHSLKATKDYLKERLREGMKPEDPVLDLSYGTIKNMLPELGKKVLGKSISAHLFRHSTATWLSNKFNKQQMCYFFGWRFSSPMPDVYISRQGIDLNPITAEFESTELEDMKIKMNDSEEQIDQLKYFILQTIDAKDKEAFIKQFGLKASN